MDSLAKGHDNVCKLLHIIVRFFIEQYVSIKIPEADYHQNRVSQVQLFRWLRTDDIDLGWDRSNSKRKHHNGWFHVGLLSTSSLIVTC